MAMSWRLVVVGLLFLGFTVAARPNSLPIGVLFHPEDNHLQYIAFKYALHRINSDIEILPEHELTPIILNVSQDDSFVLGKKVCNMVENGGVAAIFGPRAPVSLGIVQSICETLEIPNLSTATSHGGYPARCFVNLYPSQEELSKAMTDVVRGFLHWRSFTILYEDDEGLFRLQELLKSHAPDAEPLIVRQFLPGDDQRQLLKEVQASNAVHVLLDCSTERILSILQQAKELGMMDDYQSYFITSLDTHTLDFSHLAEGHTNITSLRLIDPDNIIVSSTVKFWMDWETHYKRHLNVTPETVRVDTALMHDSVFLFARALHQLYAGQQRIAVRQLQCDGIDTWHPGFNLASYMKLMEIDGMTGEIKFDVLGRRSGLHLDVVEHYGGKFKKVGYWDLENGVIGTQTETEKRAEIEKTLQTKTFIVSTRLGKPFLMERTEEGLTGNNRYEGYSKDLIDEIAKDLQFTYEFRLVKRHNDLVQDLINRRADLGICDLTITHQREQIIDFTMPFMNLGISILFRKTVKEEPRLFAFLDPFSIDVWIYMATAYLGVSILLFVLARTAPGEWDNPHPCNPEPEELENNFKMMNVLWFSIGSLMGQGCDILPKMSPTEWQNRHPCSKPQTDELETNLTMSNCIWHNCGSIMQQGSDIAPQAVSTRMVAGMWWFFTLIMISSYTANLAAFLTLNRMDSTINSAEDLAKQHKIKYGTMEGGSTAAFFKNSNDSTYKRMWTVMDQTRPTVFVSSNEEGMDRVLKAKGLYAFFMESTSIEYLVERNCELTQIGDKLDSKGYGIGLPLNSPYRTVVSGAVLKLQERGMLEELKKRWWKVEGGESCSAKEEKSAKADSNELGLDNVGGVFVVLIAGTVTAFCVAVLELLWNCRKIAVDEKITPWEALLSELKFAVSCAGTKKASHVKSSEADEEEEEEEEDEDNMPAGATAGSFVRLGFEKFTEK